MEYTISTFEMGWKNSRKDVEQMIQREDILSMEYLKKTEYTGCHQGMRYRLEKSTDEEENQFLKVTIWPEPFNFFTTPQESKETEMFGFHEDGVVDAIAWMNDKLFQEKEKWDSAKRNWDSYSLH